MKESILIVEDDVGNARLITLELEHENYKTTWVADGGEGLAEALKNDYDLIILDVMLPSLNGIEVLRRLTVVKDTPVIILTARGQIVDKVAGLDLGASDYMTKPFDTQELLARVRARLRKKGAVQNRFTLGRLAVEIDSRRVAVDNTDIELTKKEFDLLVYLLQNKDTVSSREKIINSVWGFEYFGNTNLVDVYIRYLRSKIEDPFGLRLIKTVRGSGYALREQE